MAIYIIFFLLNMLVGALMLSKKNKNNPIRKSGYLTFTTLQYGILAGLRSANVGWDTVTYERLFNEIPDSFQAVASTHFREEIGFNYLCSLIKICGGNYQAFLLITSIFIVGSCCIFIYRHSHNVLMSVFIILCFPYYYTSLDIIRHYLAVSFFLLGYKYVIQRDFIKFLIFILLGSLFHRIAFLFLAFYFIRYFKWNAITAALSIAVTAFLTVYLDTISTAIMVLLHKTDYTNSYWVGVEAGGGKTMIMYLIVLIIAILGFHNIKPKSRTIIDSDSVTQIMFLFLCAVIFMKARMIIRLMVVFIPLMAIAMPRFLCDKERAGNRMTMRILNGVFICIGTAYHVYLLASNWQNVVPYETY